MKAGNYEIEILVQGFPGKSPSHGGLGWSTVALIRGGGRVALVDTGSFGMRRLLVKRLADHDLQPSDVTDVLLTHAHHDHMVNWPMFREARIFIGAHELETAAREPWGETPTPEFSVHELQNWPTLRAVAEEETIWPGLAAHLAPGHTRGHLIFVLSAGEEEVIFAGDAVKNRTELISRQADMTYDPEATRASIENIWTLWRRRPGTVLIPGHDLPMVLADEAIQYVGERDAGIAAWFGDTLETTTQFRFSAE
jgi:glyoxylase-like metal-dependent hydrolase (beta-lactamase superfamily II)